MQLGTIRCGATYFALDFFGNTFDHQGPHDSRQIGSEYWGQFYQHDYGQHYAPRSQKRKKLLDLAVFFALMGFAFVKAAGKMLVKLTPEFAYQTIHDKSIQLKFG